MISRIERNDPLQAETLGLTLTESKALLEALQRELVESQFHLHIEKQRSCKTSGHPVEDLSTRAGKSLGRDDANAGIYLGYNAG